MSAKTETPLRLELKCSKHLINIMIFMCASALLASTMNSLPVTVKAVLFIAIVLYGSVELTRLRTQQYCLEHIETGWRLAAGHEFAEIEILPSTVVSTVAIFLHYKTEKIPKQSLLIFSDALAKDDYRQLIVRLKITHSDQDKSG